MVGATHSDYSIGFSRNKRFADGHSKKFDESEFLTLAKFLAIAGVVLPLTPDKIILPGLELTPYKFWLAVVAVSTISYVSYLLRKFVFPGSGLIVTGILGIVQQHSHRPSRWLKRVTPPAIHLPQPQGQ